MSAITSASPRVRSSDHRDYRVLLGLTTPFFVAGVALRRLGLKPAGPASASFAAAVRTRAAAVIPFAFMG